MKIVPINPNRSGRYIRAKGDLYNTYLGPLSQNIDVFLRRNRVGRLMWFGIRKGWMPKMGLLRARKFGPTFRKEQAQRLRDAFHVAAGYDLEWYACYHCEQVCLGRKDFYHVCANCVERGYMGPAGPRPTW